MIQVRTKLLQAKESQLEIVLLLQQHHLEDPLSQSQNKLRKKQSW
jgi:hypothetical protein